MPPSRLVPLCLCFLLVGTVLAHPTVYRKRDADTLSPVLVPVSSTVVPLPIYKVGYSLNASSGNKKIYDPDVKLITVKTKNKGKYGASVKAITREDFETSL